VTCPLKRLHAEANALLSWAYAVKLPAIVVLPLCCGTHTCKYQIWVQVLGGLTHPKVHSHHIGIFSHGPTIHSLHIQHAWGTISQIKPSQLNAIQNQIHSYSCSCASAGGCTHLGTLRVVRADLLVQQVTLASLPFHSLSHII